MSMNTSISNSGGDGKPSSDTMVDEDDAGGSYRPLPLSDFGTYKSLISVLYRTSTAVILGNSLEWLDFSIYGYSESDISQQLFGGSTTVGWATFGLGFAFRPVGAYVLGKLSDEKSRNLSFIIAMLSMATSTALMSLIPAVCDEPGVTVKYCVPNLLAAAIPAVFLRCIQGFSAGAASGGVNVIQSELWSTTERKGAIAQSVGVNNVSGGLASMVSAAVVLGLRAAMGETRYAAWGWRIAFLLVVPPSLFASYLMHRSTPESNDFAKHDGCDEEDDDCVEEAPILGDRKNETKPNDQLQDAQSGVVDEECASGGRHDKNEAVHALTPPWLLISVLIFAQFAIAAFNNLNVYLVDFVQTDYGVSANMSTLMVVVGKGVQVLMTPFAAITADIKGWFWTCAVGGALCTVLAVPMMAAGILGGVPAVWVLVSIVLPIVSTFWILNAPLLATSVFSVERRSQGTSMVLAVSAAMAGFFPLLMDLIPNIYTKGGVLAIIALFGTIGILWIRNRAKRGKIIIYQRPELY